MEEFEPMEDDLGILGHIAKREKGGDRETLALKRNGYCFWRA